MSDKDLALGACDDGFKAGVQQLMSVLFINWIDAKNQAGKDEALQRFQLGLSLYKDARQGAETVIGKVFP